METAIRQSLNLKLKSCPRCGGDICRTRDTFGVYHQCAQCGREIRIGMSGSPLDAGDAGVAVNTKARANASANAKGMGVSGNPTEHKMELVV